MAIFSNPLFATYSVYARNASIAVSAVEKFYIGTHLWSRPLNHCDGIFFKSLRNGAHKLFCRFLDFSEFLTISRMLWWRKWELCSLSERALPSEMGWKLHQNRLINHDNILVQSMSPSYEQSAGLGVWQAKNIQTPYLCTYSQHTLINLPKLLTGDRGRWYH